MQDPLEEEMWGQNTYVINIKLFYPYSIQNEPQKNYSETESDESIDDEIKYDLEIDPGLIGPKPNL